MHNAFVASCMHLLKVVGYYARFFVAASFRSRSAVIADGIVQFLHFLCNSELLCSCLISYCKLMLFDENGFLHHAVTHSRVQTSISDIL